MSIGKLKNIMALLAMMTLFTSASLQAAPTLKQKKGPETNSLMDKIRIAKLTDPEVEAFQASLEAALENPNGAFACVKSVYSAVQEEGDTRLLYLDYSDPFVAELLGIFQDHLSELRNGDSASFMAWVSKMIYGQDEYACLKAPSTAKQVIADLVQKLFSQATQTVSDDGKQPNVVAAPPNGGPLEAAPKDTVPNVVIVDVPAPEREIPQPEAIREVGTTGTSDGVVGVAVGTGGSRAAGFEVGGEGCALHGHVERSAGSLQWILLLLLPALLRNRKYV